MTRHQTTILVLTALIGAVPAPLACQTADPAWFVAHLETLAPRLLTESGVPGVAVSLVRHGEVILATGWGVADRATRRPVHGATRFNVGSIAKTVTAWGVMKLVENGLIDLDAPVRRYLRRWDLPTSAWDRDAVTVRGLLEHTAGISQPSVPSRPAGTALPSVPESLANPDDPVHLVQAPGTAWTYSGGGYVILQLLIEDASGRPFADFMRDEILLPLEMHRSFFGPPGDAIRATPYDTVGVAPALYWPGMAAADLYTTAVDLARFLAASNDSRTRSRGWGVLAPETVDVLRTPSAGSRTRLPPLRYGLGHEIWPLPDGTPAVGHNGQNDGWAAAAWWIPATGDGLVVLTNHSDGRNVHRWIVCDWLAWAVEPAWGPYCAGREAHPTSRIAPVALAPPSPRTAKLREILDAAVPDPRNPGVAVGVMREGRAMLLAARGLADLDRTTPLTPQTPFYLASVAKPITAAAVGLLIARGLLTSHDRVDRFVPGLGRMGAVTIGDLLDHRSGIPDYHRWIEWPRLRTLGNAAVLDTLRAHPEPDFAPGTRFSYSNSNYVLLAEIVGRVTGASLREFLLAEIADPLELTTLDVDDADRPPAERAARGYAAAESGFRLSDYETLDVPGAGFRATFALTLTGAGGAHGSVEDIMRWGAAVMATGLPDAARVAPPAPEELAELGPSIGRVTGYRAGWFVGTLDDRTVFWHDGNRGGFQSVLLLVPSEQLVVVALANRSDLIPERLAERLARAAMRPREAGEP